MVRKLAGNTIDLVLLDIGLQQESGLDLMKTALLDTGVPVVILTGKSDPIERVVGLELGADDYIVKPYLNRELLARIRAVLRRTAAPQLTAARPECLCYRSSPPGGWTYNPGEYIQPRAPTLT